MTISVEENIKNAERMARLETEVKNSAEILVRMEKKLDTWSENYVTKRELDNQLRFVDRDIKQVRADMESNFTQRDENKKDNKALLASWVSIAVAVLAVVVAIVN